MSADCTHANIEDSFKPEEPEPSPEVTPEEVTDLDALQRSSWMEKIRFAWRSEDEEILKRIEAAADDMFAEMFTEAITEVERFYAALRVPRTRNGIVVLDSQQRPVWEKDERGYVERWDQLTGQDIEQIIMNLSRIKMWLSPQVNKLKNQAVYGKMAADDAKDDAWGKVMQGTQGDRTANANRHSRVDRYHAFFRYSLWSTADVFLKELVDFMFRLKDVRNWRVQSQQR